MSQNDVRKVLGERIKARREEKELSVDDLAERANIGLSTLYKIEKGTANPGITVVENLANALDTSVSDLLGAPRAEDIAATLSFSGAIHTPDDILKHEEDVLKWEQRVNIRRMILPFFSNIHQTDEVALHIREYGCHNYSRMKGSFTVEQLDLFREILRRRRESFKLDKMSHEIASGPEITRFAEGEGKFEQLEPVARRKQLDYIIELIKEELIPGVEIRVLEEPIYIMEGLYGNNHVTIGGRGIYLELFDLDTMRSFLENFYDLWRVSLAGGELIDFLEEQKKYIK